MANSSYPYPAILTILFENPGATNLKLNKNLLPYLFDDPNAEIPKIRESLLPDDLSQLVRDVVKLTGDQVINGAKTFTTAPLLHIDNEGGTSPLASEAYVNTQIDTALGNIDSGPFEDNDIIMTPLSISSSINDLFAHTTGNNSSLSKINTLHGEAEAYVAEKLINEYYHPNLSLYMNDVLDFENLGVVHGNVGDNASGESDSSAFPRSFKSNRHSYWWSYRDTIRTDYSWDAGEIIDRLSINRVIAPTYESYPGHIVGEERGIDIDNGSIQPYEIFRPEDDTTIEDLRPDIGTLSFADVTIRVDNADSKFYQESFAWENISDLLKFYSLDPDSQYSIWPQTDQTTATVNVRKQLGYMELKDTRAYAIWSEFDGANSISFGETSIYHEQVKCVKIVGNIGDVIELPDLVAKTSNGDSTYVKSYFGEGYLTIDQYNTSASSGVSAVSQSTAVGTIDADNKTITLTANVRDDDDYYLLYMCEPHDYKLALPSHAPAIEANKDFGNEIAFVVRAEIALKNGLLYCHYVPSNYRACADGVYNSVGWPKNRLLDVSYMTRAMSDGNEIDALDTSLASADVLCTDNHLDVKCRVKTKTDAETLGNDPYKYAEIEKTYGVSEVGMQIAPLGVYGTGPATTLHEENGITISKCDTMLVASGTASDAVDFAVYDGEAITLRAGHDYLVINGMGWGAANLNYSGNRVDVYGDFKIHRDTNWVEVKGLESVSADLQPRLVEFDAVDDSTGVYLTDGLPDGHGVNGKPGVRHTEYGASQVSDEPDYVYGTLNAIFIPAQQTDTQITLSYHIEKGVQFDAPIQTTGKRAGYFESNTHAIMPLVLDASIMYGFRRDQYARDPISWLQTNVLPNLSVRIGTSSRRWSGKGGKYLRSINCVNKPIYRQENLMRIISGYTTTTNISKATVSKYVFTIPTAILSLPGYGAAFMGECNYVDWKAGTYHQRVGVIDITEKNCKKNSVIALPFASCVQEDPRYNMCILVKKPKTEITESNYDALLLEVKPGYTDGYDYENCPYYISDESGESGETSGGDEYGDSGGSEYGEYGDSGSSDYNSDYNSSYGGGYGYNEGTIPVFREDKMNEYLIPLINHRPHGCLILPEDVEVGSRIYYLISHVAYGQGIQIDVSKYTKNRLIAVDEYNELITESGPYYSLYNLDVAKMMEYNVRTVNNYENKRF